MSDFELAKEICTALERAEKETRNTVYLLKAESLKKVKNLEQLLMDEQYSMHFDRLTNSLEITLTGYVFDSLNCDLKSIFQTVDLFVIDAMKDGRIYIEMKILNAAEVMGRD